MHPFVRRLLGDASMRVGLLGLFWQVEVWDQGAQRGPGGAGSVHDQPWPAEPSRPVDPAEQATVLPAKVDGRLRDRPPPLTGAGVQ